MNTVKQFNLSDKAEILVDHGKKDTFTYNERYVKEFIKRILVELDFLSTPNWREAEVRISKLAGDKLTK